MIPLTFHIQKGLDDPEFVKFENYFKSIEHPKKHSYWIVKPGENSNRGNGIMVCDNIRDIRNLLNHKHKHEDG